MTKLKKLFPLSFKFTKSPVKLFLGILLYLVINAVASLVVDTVISILMAPLLIFAIPYVGWILALVCLPVLLVYILVLSYVNSFALALVNIYTCAGIVVAFIAYAKSEDENANEAVAEDAELELESEEAEAEENDLPELDAPEADEVEEADKTDAE